MTDRLLDSRGVTAPRPVPVVLSIAGSDSGGGAGIQADLKAFAAAGVHGATAITAITVQNTVAVSAVETVPPAIIEAQIRAVAEDLGVDAVKIGMLGDIATIEAVAAGARRAARRPAGRPRPGDGRGVRRPAAAGRRAHRARAAILPRATVVTPNLPEARVLAGRRRGGSTGRSSRVPSTRSARAPSSSPAVIATQATDLLFDGETLTELPGERHPDGASHGSGCTHSSTLAARLALGDTLPEAARRARAAAAAAVRDGLRDLGAGAGPVDVIGLAGRRAR